MRSDRELVGRVLDRGDEQAFRQLFRRHTPRLLAFALRLVGGSAADAEDVVQETWIRASRGFATFRWSAALGTWLHGIAINVCREHVRREHRHDHAPLDAGEGWAEGIAGGDAADGRPIDLERAIQGLPNGYREVLVLHDIEGYTHEEIGARLGISAGGSKSQLSRARRAMRAALSGDTGERP